MRTIPGITEDLKQIDEIISSKFIPAITGGIQPNAIERKLFSLPPSQGGLCIPIFNELADRELNNSQQVSEQLKLNIVAQHPPNNICRNTIASIKSNISLEKTKFNLETLESIRSSFSEEKNKLIDISREKGASLWLTTLPIRDEGFQLDKQSFWDLIKIRYGYQLSRLPNDCSCGSKFDLEHALSCKKGGFVSLRHNILRNMTAKMLTETCKDVRLEPPLNPLSGEVLNETTANSSDEARVDVAARGFWISGQKAFFDIRVFNPLAKRYRNSKVSNACRMNEIEKKRQYNERILKVEHGSFTPLVFSAMGGMGRESQMFFKRLSESLSDSRCQQLSVTVTWIRRKVIFALMKSVILCLRGSRTPWVKDNLTDSLSNSSENSELLCSF